MTTKYVVTQMGHWMVKQGGGWTLKLSEARKLDSHEAALKVAFNLNRTDLTIKAITEEDSK